MDRCTLNAVTRGLKYQGMAVLGLVGLSLIGCQSGPQHPLPAGFRQPFPTFELSDSLGQTFQYHGPTGRVLVLALVDTFVPQAGAQIMQMNQLQQEMADLPVDFVGLILNIDELPPEKLAAYHKSQSPRFPLLVANRELANQLTRRSGGLQKIPSVMLVDHQGRIAVFHSGLVLRQVLRDQVMQLVAQIRATEKAVSTP